MRGVLKVLSIVLVSVFGVAACDSQSTEEKVEQFLQSAAEKREAGKLDAAVIELKNALQVAPENAQARRELGQLYLEQGQGKPAAKELRRALEHGGESAEVKRELAQALLLAGEPKEVLDLVPPPDAGAVRAGDRLELYGLRAQALLETGETDAAMALAEQVVAAGESVEAQLTLARAYAGRNQFEAALQHLEPALERQPDHVHALWMKGVALMQLGRMDDALATLQTAREQPWRPAQVDIAVLEIALQQNNRDLAWQVLDSLDKQFPDDPRVKYFRALRALSEERYDEARQQAEGVAGQYPNFVQAAYVAGAANFQLENFELARQYLETFVNANPDNRRARALLAQAWQKLGETERAREVAQPLEGGAQDRREPGRQYARAGAATDVEGLEGSEPSLETPDAQREQARIILEHVRNGEFETALEKAEALGGELPDSALPLQLQSVVLWARGDRSEAIARMEAASERAPSNANVALNLARMHRVQGDAEASLAALEPALEAHPDNVDLKVEAARAYARRNDAAKVQALLEGALEADAQATGARAYLARFHLVQGQPDKALAVVEAAPGEQADNPALLEVVGRAQQAKGELEAALAAFRKLAEAVPDRGEGPLRVGETLLAMNRPDEAAEAFEKARERLDPPREAELYLARALLQSGQGARAGTLIAELEEKYPSESAVAILRGNHALSVEGDPQAAVQAFEKALELEPNETRLLDLVQLHTRLGQVDKAIGRLERWRAENDASIRVESALAELHLTSGHLDAAGEVYMDLVERVPDNAAFQNNLAWVLGEQGKLDRALEHARKAADLAPSDPGVQDTLGVVLLKRGETAEAREYLAKAAQAAPGRADIQVNYADALIAAGAREEARAVLARLAAEDLSSSLRQRVDELLSQIE